MRLTAGQKNCQVFLTDPSEYEIFFNQPQEEMIFVVVK